MALKALIFDVDGTLADTERDGHRVAYNAAFREVGLDWDWTEELYGPLLKIAGGKERIRHYLEHYRPDHAAMGDQEIAGLHAVKTRYYTALIADGGIPLRHGVRRLLRGARDAGLRLAIATTTTPDNVTALLRHVLGGNTEDWFEVIGAGDVVPNKKPAADIYNYVLQQMGLDADDAFAFEDSRNGLLSAQGAGVKTVVTANSYTRNQDFSGAQIVLDHLGEPEQPCSILAGATINGFRYVDVDFLKTLYAV